MTFVYVDVTPAQLPNLLNVLEDMADRGEVVGYGEESEHLREEQQWFEAARDQRSEGEPPEEDGPPETLGPGEVMYE